MKITETGARGRIAIKHNYPFILGISINNSYFKEENLERLITWSSFGNRKVYVMIPDEPSIHTMVALGKERSKAEKVARLKSNSLENKCLKIASKLGVTVKIVRWKNINQNEEYLYSLNHIRAAYERSIPFKDAVVATTREVLASNHETAASESQIDESVQFLLKELAFIIRADNILKESSIVYVYHRTMQIMKDILEDDIYPIFPGHGVGFITAE